MPEGSKVSLLPFARSYVEPLGSYMSKANVRSISKCEQLSSKEKQDGNVETGGASEPPLAHRLALQAQYPVISVGRGGNTGCTVQVAPLSSCRSQPATCLTIASSSRIRTRLSWQ